MLLKQSLKYLTDLFLRLRLTLLCLRSLRCQAASFQSSLPVDTKESPTISSMSSSTRLSPSSALDCKGWTVADCSKRTDGLPYSVSSKNGLCVGLVKYALNTLAAYPLPNREPLSAMPSLSSMNVMPYIRPLSFFRINTRKPCSSSLCRSSSSVFGEVRIVCNTLYLMIDINGLIACLDFCILFCTAV